MKILKLKSVTLASTVVANALYVRRPVNRQKKILHADEFFGFGLFLSSLVVAQNI